MAGLVPAIHVFLWAPPQDVDARDKRGHDDEADTVLYRRALAEETEEDADGTRAS
jgi:hypothetical protein